MDKVGFVTRRPRTLALCAATLGLATVGSVPGRAQETGGRLLTFGIEQRLEASNNRALAADPAGGTFTSDTNLSFALSSNTQVQSLALDGRLALRLAAGEDTGDTGFTAVSYTHLRACRGVNSSFGLSATYLQGEVAFLSPLDFLNLPDGTVDEDGNPIPIEIGDDDLVDLADLTGEGTRRDASISARLALGEERPLGFNLAGRVATTDYSDITSGDLSDSTRAGLDAGVRLSVAPAVTVSIDFGVSTIDTEGEARRDTRSFDGGLSFARPRGDINLNAGLTDTDEGTRTSLNFGRSFDLPRGSLSFSLGTTLTADGGTQLTGSLTGSRELAQGDVSGSLRRNVTTATDGETVVTALSADYSRALTSRVGLSLDTGVVLTDETETGETGQSAQASAQLNFALARDWSLGTGASYRRRESSDNEGADETSVFVTLGRSFAFRP